MGIETTGIDPNPVTVSFNPGTQVGQQVDRALDVPEPGNILILVTPVHQQRRHQYRQGGILGAADFYTAADGPAAFDDDFVHGCLPTLTLDLTLDLNPNPVPPKLRYHVDRRKD
jgi:hypothetical protein